MAPPPGTLRVSRYFIALGLILGLLYLIVFIPGTGANTPKLGIDLVGGIRVIFTAQPTGGGEVTQTSMEQARQIIEDRINGSGVSTSTVQIQGNDQLVVSIPGGTDTDVAALGKAAQLNFRPVIAPGVPTGCDTKKKAITSIPTATTSGEGTASSSTPSGKSAGQSSTTSVPRATSAPSGGASGNSYRERLLAAPSTATTAPAKSTVPASATKSRAAINSTAPASGGKTTAATPSPSATQAAPACLVDPVSLLTKADKTLKIPTTEAEFGKLTQQQQQGIAQALASFNCDTANRQADSRDSFYIACSQSNGQSIAYLLGKVILRGTQVDEANAIAPSTGSQGSGSTVWTVALNLDDSGQTAWGNWTKAHNIGSSSAQAGNVTQCGNAAAAQGGSGTPCSDYVAFTLDGAVISTPPVTEGPIIGKTTQITGGFNQTSANALADQLKFGALPLSFRTDSNERVSASLGTSQLKAAFLAGGIGLALVVVYSLLYYRGLGLVTIASLIVSGLLTYAMMVILGQQIGFTLDLAGIAGLIVALGITADSFVVFFERIKDEVHEGRSVRVAVPRGWVRARRTVISADVVSFLAALILYIFASADVKGFAFTLGLSTILDLFVVVVFTHPIVALLSRSKAFASPRFTGLSSVRAGGITQDTDRPRGKRTARPQQGTAAERAAARRGNTVTLDKPDTAGEVEGTDELPDDAVNDTTSDTTPDNPPPPANPPAGGTAAERAAARRARQRRERDEKGE